MKEQGTGQDGGSGVRALLVFDTPLAALVATTLRHARFETRRVAAEDEVAQAIREWRPHLVLIDIDHYEGLLDAGVLPTDGFAVVAFTRKRDTGVKLRAFERGVDDIVEVPFTLDEIMVRPYALVRRVHGMSMTLAPKIRLGALEVDLMQQAVTLDGGRRLELTPIQQALLYILAANAGKTLSREALLSNIWGAEFEIESNVVDRHIRELRVKLGDDWRTPRYIETIAGEGYRFRTAEAAPARMQETVATAS